MMYRLLTIGLTLGFLNVLAPSTRAEPSLHERIDQLIAGSPGYAAQTAPIASDAEFFRRIHLDLTGCIPSAAEARAFLGDSAADKRAQLIDRLLASPEHARHLQNVFDVLLMERRPDKFVPRAQWHEYLRTSFAANKPWDELAREILSADGTDPKTRPAAKFYLDRAAEPNLLTKDISRLFLGMNLQCAQCHDHPRVRHYHQEHYYGIYAFLNRSYLFTDPKTKVTVLAEKAEGDVTYVSVFDPAKVTKATGPRMPNGPAIKEPEFAKGTEYQVPPAKNIRPVPKFSRRSQLAVYLANAEHLPFKRNIANRLWALMLGRGLVDPVDFDHPSNPPSHPELLDLLAKEMAARKFDMRAILRELALSKTYQRSSELPAGGMEVGPERFTVAALKPLSPEQLAFSLLQATGLTDSERAGLGKKLTEAALHARLAPSAAAVVRIFAGPSGQVDTFQATLGQALFVANSKVIRGWLGSRPGNLTDRLAKLAKGEDAAEELYLSILTRRPTEEEKREVVDYLKTRRSDRSAALQELAWALLASAEFRFNH